MSADPVRAEERRAYQAAYRVKRREALLETRLANRSPEELAHLAVLEEQTRARVERTKLKAERAAQRERNRRAKGKGARAAQRLHDALCSYLPDAHHAHIAAYRRHCQREESAALMEELRALRPPLSPKFTAEQMADPAFYRQRYPDIFGAGRNTSQATTMGPGFSPAGVSIT